MAVGDSCVDKRYFIKRTLAASLSHLEIASATVTCGFIQRSRKISPVEFLLTLIFGFFSKEEPSIAKHHRLYNSLVDDSRKVCYSSFYGRFSADALTFIDTILSTVLVKQMQGASIELKGYLRTFQDILIKDNTIIRVSSYLNEKYPATRSQRVAAGIKVSLLLSVVRNGPHSVAFFAEKTNDLKTLTIGPWVKDRLLLIDRGFFKFALFAAIDAFQGRFVTRIKANTNATIVSLTLDTPEHLRHQLLGTDIQQAMAVLKPYQQDIDALVTIPCDGKKRNRKNTVLQVRFIALYNQ
jgi:hypothetical protein